MRIAVASGLAVAALGAGGAMASSAVGTTHSCGLKGSKTVQRIGHVRVYRFHGAIYGCSTLYGKRIRVSKGPDQFGCFTDVYAEANDTVLAVAHDQSLGYARLTSWDLSKGARLRRYLFNYDSPGCGSIYKLVTNASGSLAWIGLTTEHENGATVVDKDDSGGFTPLDYQAPPLCQGSGGNCGDSIDASYLSASGGMVFWKNQNGVQSASFN